MQTITEILAQELGQKLEYVENVVRLIDEGNTIPFIARYRKEMHGAMDDTTLRALETRLTYLRNLQDRRDEVKKAIENQGKLTPELSAAIDAAGTMTEVEDLYRPYKQKRRTRGSIAREKGLEPLAEAIFAQDGQDPQALALDYIDPEKGVNTAEEALQGANDTAFIASTMTSASLFPGCWITRFWPSTGGKRKAFSSPPSPSPATKVPHWYAVPL